MQNLSPLQKARLAYLPKIPAILKNLNEIELQKEPMEAFSNLELQGTFPLTSGQPLIRFVKGKKHQNFNHPLRVGVVLSGGQAPGGHNVITGLLDSLMILHKESLLFGFLGGPAGIVNSKYKELNADALGLYRNQGGFDLIGSGRTKIETDDQLKQSMQTVTNLKLDGLVVIGGDDSNTNAAVLAEYFKKNGCSTQVIGVPKTIDGDLKNEYIECSFGFDTACKVYSEAIGNIARDALSAKKYTHFIKLMGRSASHIALECAIQTHPNVTLIGEEIAFHKKTLKQITDEIADVVQERALQGKNYGIVLIPEGLIEFIQEIGILTKELNNLLAEHAEAFNKLIHFSEKITYLSDHLSKDSKECLDHLPALIQEQLLKDRDPHGNLQVAAIETERLLMVSVAEELSNRKKAGKFTGLFSPQGHSFGYEGRSALPSNFDSNYCYTLGSIAALSIASGLTGTICFVQNLKDNVENWKPGALPIASLMTIEERKGKKKPVIRKALVELEGSCFQFFKSHKKSWAIDDSYSMPGPIQFFGEPSLTDSVPATL